MPTVFVPPSNRRGRDEKYYHTDPDCGYLKRAGGVEKPLNVLGGNWEYCSRCAARSTAGRRAIRNVVETDSRVELVVSATGSKGHLRVDGSVLCYAGNSQRTFTDVNDLPMGSVCGNCARDAFQAEIVDTPDVSEKPLVADGGEDVGRGDHHDPHVPTPIERERPDGSLRVVEDTGLRSREPSQIVVDAEDRDLYALLSDVLTDIHVPDLFPAALATAAEDTADALDRVTSIDRGFIDPPLPGASYALSYAKNAAEALREYRDRDPLRLALMGCSGSKHDVDEPVPARDLYARGYWTVKERYGSVVGDDWRILSAEHAVLHPDEEIGYYERVPEDLRGIPVDSDESLPSGDAVEDRLDHWALSVYNGLTRWLHEAVDDVDPRDVELQVCVGERYRDKLEARGVFDRLGAPAGLSVSFPFQEEPEAAGGIGPQQSWMNSVVDEVAATDGGEAGGE